MRTPKKFKRYVTIESLMANLLEIPEKEVGDFNVGYIGGEVSIKSITKQGIWGYVDKKCTVHYWMKDSVSFENILMFIAHETGHINGRQFKGHSKEEEKASLFDQVALFAYNKAMEIRP